MHILSLVTDNNPSWMIQQKGGELPKKLFHDQSPRKYVTVLDWTRDPWICRQTPICCQTRYRLRYAARYTVPWGMSLDYTTNRHEITLLLILCHAWMKVFRIIPEFRILRLTFHRKSASKCWIRKIITASLIYFQSVRTFKLIIVNI